LEEVASTADSLWAAAARIAAGQVAPGESFAFRMHKRGAHEYMQATPELEREVGTAIWAARAT
jgi:tRNA(Ser,Leu) C12 N-acetylase TAN1